MTPEKQRLYRKAYVEIIEILRYLDISQRSLIPENYIRSIINDRDPDYVFVFDTKKGIFEQDLMTETKALLVEIYERYLAPPEEKQMWEKYDKYCEDKKKADRIQQYESMLEDDDDND